MRYLQNLLSCKRVRRLVTTVSLIGLISGCSFEGEEKLSLEGEITNIGWIGDNEVQLTVKMNNNQAYLATSKVGSFNISEVRLDTLHHGKRDPIWNEGIQMELEFSPSPYRFEKGDRIDFYLNSGYHKTPIVDTIKVNQNRFTLRNFAIDKHLSGRITRHYPSK